MRAQVSVATKRVTTAVDDRIRKKSNQHGDEVSQAASEYVGDNSGHQS